MTMRIVLDVSVGRSIFTFVVSENDMPRTIDPTTQRNVLEDLQLTLQTELKSGRLLLMAIAVKSREFTCDLHIQYLYLFIGENLSEF